MENPQFLKKKYNTLHSSPEVQSAAKRNESHTGEKLPQSPEKQIQNYLDRFSEILNRESPEERQQGIEALKKVLHRELVIQPDDVPYRVFELEQDIAEQKGHGRPEINERFKQEKIEQIIHDQQESLDTWINYLTSPDAMYPDWAKYWAFRSMTQMGGYNKEKGKFGKRKKDTVHAFPTLNAGCLAEVIGAIEKKQQHKDLSELDPEFKDLLSTENFAKLYTYTLEQFGDLNWENLENIKGIWKKYEQGSEPDELVASLRGFPLEWCTRNETTARNQLKGGDFHVYYSQNNQGVANVPRLAIRMNGHSSIAEIRGVESNQNIDQYIQPVLDEKLNEFGSEGESYLKKSEDMKRMTAITKKHRNGVELSADDLRFLYELDGTITGFGYQKDPRIKELKEGRDEQTDLASVFQCNPEQIALTKQEALSGHCVYYGKDIDLKDLTLPNKLALPEHLRGKLDLRSLNTLGDLKLPRYVGSDLYLNGLNSANKIILPKHVEGDILLGNLTSVEKIKLPEYSKGNIYLTKLRSIKELKLPMYAEGYIDLRSLSSANGLIINKNLKGTIDLRGLKTTNGLILPDHFKGSLNLDGLTKVKDLKLPIIFEGNLFLRGLDSIIDLVLPADLKGAVYLKNDVI
jgi:hypothetical protein